MGIKEALAEGAALFYQARLPPDRPSGGAHDVA
jgi:hypothetical protein